MKHSKSLEDSNIRLSKALQDLWVVDTGTGSEIDGLILPEERWEQINGLKGCYWQTLKKGKVQAYRILVGHDTFPDDPHKFPEKFMLIYGGGTWLIDGVPHIWGAYGDKIYIPAGTRHQFTANEETLLIGIQEGSGFPNAAER